MNLKEKGKKGIAAVVVTASMLGGVLGGTLIGGMVHAQSANTTVAGTTTTAPAVETPTVNDPADTNQSGTTTFKSNEDPKHEAGESAAREAQEDAGQRPTVK